MAVSRYGGGVENQHRGADGKPLGDGHDSGDGDASIHPTPQTPTSPRQHIPRDTGTGPGPILAAGGVLWRHDSEGAVQVAGVYRPVCDNWSLPKGKLDADEHRLLGACREVEEETGIAAIPQTFLTTARYRLPRPGGDVTKIVDFWSMRARDPQARFIPNDEVTVQRWLPIDEALSILTRPRDQQALKAFRALPPVTATVVLLRHAHAESPATYTGPDVTRPLDATGLGDAARLVGLLASYDPQQIITATPQRCVNTVAPLAAATSIQVTGESVFDAESHLRNPERAVQRVRELADTLGTTVVCSQAPVIADSLAILADTDDIRLPSVHTPMGGVWVLSFNHKTLVAVERL